MTYKKYIKCFIGLFVFICIGCDKSSSFQGYVPNHYVKVWGDSFKGLKVSTDNWIIGTLRDPVSGDLVPGAIGDHLLNHSYAGYITKENVYIKNSALVLRNQKRSYHGANPKGVYNYTSGWVMTMHRVYFKKGYLEIRAKFPTGNKVWPAFWLVSENLEWPPEWDMFEYFGYRPNVGFDVMGTHLATGKSSDVQWNSHWIQNFSTKYNKELWHIYGFQWTENYAAWYIDGKQVHKLVRQGSWLEKHWPDEKMYIILNNGIRSAALDSATVWPNYVKVDWIKLYKRKGKANLFTKPSG